MIQLTKGTNILDINLSDYSGAGQDVVQNGSFDDIGSDLILNGDFAEIGSDLVTNGDFSAAGSNLVDNPNFTDGVEGVVGGNFESGLIGTVDNFGGSVYSWALNTVAPISGTQDGLFAITVNGTSNSYPRLGFDGGLELDKSYVLTFDYKVNSGTTYFGSISRGGGSSEGVSITLSGSGTYTYYFVAQGTGLLSLNFNGRDYLFNTQFDNVSIKELGADWTLFSDVSVGEDKLICDNVSAYTSIASQSGIVPTQKSVKVTYDVVVDSGAFRLLLGSGGTTSEVTTSGTKVFYETSGTGGVLTLQARGGGFDGTVTNVSVQELGEGWYEQDTGAMSIVAEGLKITTATAGSNRVSQNDVTEDGKSYKVTVVVDSISTPTLNDKLFYYDGLAYINIPLTTPKSYTFYYTRVGTLDRWIFDLRNGATTSDNIVISSITVQEVGQDWTVTNSDSTQYVEFFGGVGGARIVVPDAATSPILTLTANGITLLAGKHYKLIVDVTVVTGSVKYDVTGTTILYDTTEVKTAYFSPASNVGLSFYRASSNVDVTFNSVIIQELDTNNRWVTFADPDSKSVMKLGQVDLEIDSSGNNCGVYQTGLIKPNKLYIITINMKATAALNVEIAASLGTAVSAVIGTTALTTSYVEYSFEYVTPFAVAHDLQIHRLSGSGDSETISIDYVSMNGVDESKWINDPTWDPFATSLVYVPTLTDESTNNSKQFTLDTSIANGGWNGRSLHGQVTINESPTEDPANGIINLEQPNFLEGFYQVEIRGYLGTFYRILGKGMAHLERASTEDGYNRFEAYNDSVTYKAYEQ